MFNILWIIFFVLETSFSNYVLELGSPEFQSRQVAHKILKKWTPISFPACFKGINESESLEVSYRCEKIVKPLDEIREILNFGKIIEDLIKEPSELDGLPHLSLAKYSDYKENESARIAFKIKVESLRNRGFFKNQKFQCERKYWGYYEPNNWFFDATYYAWPEFSDWREGNLSGIQSVRYVLRGLPEPQYSGFPEWYTKALWKAKKELAKIETQKGK